MPDAKGIANGKHVVADLQAVGLADSNGGEFLRGNLQQRDVGRRIGADELCSEFATIFQRHDNLGCAFDDVVIGEHVAFCGVDNHA